MIAVLTRAEAQELIDMLEARIDDMQYDHFANDEDETVNQAVVILLRNIIKKLTPVEATK